LFGRSFEVQSLDQNLLTMRRTRTLLNKRCKRLPYLTALLWLAGWLAPALWNESYRDRLEDTSAQIGRFVRDVHLGPMLERAGERVRKVIKPH
jgi:hypothetical protein